MSHHNVPHRKPDKSWLVKALESVDGYCLDTPEERGSIADHILGNWLTIEDAREHTLLVAARALVRYLKELGHLPYAEGPETGPHGPCEACILVLGAETAITIASI